MSKTVTLDILLVRDRVTKGFTALVLQHDIAAQGRTVEDAIDSLIETICVEIAYHRHQNKQPFEMLRKSPDRYWRMHEEAISLPVPPSLIQPTLSEELEEQATCNSLRLAA